MKKVKLGAYLILLINLLILNNPIESNIKKDYFATEIKGNFDGNKKNDGNYFLTIPYLINNIDIIKESSISFNNLQDKREIIIYGNSSLNQELPFNILEDYVYNTYFEENPIIYFINNNLKETYLIFSVFKSSTILPSTTKDEENTYLLYLNYLQNKSLYNIDYEFNNNDKIIALETNSVLDENTYIIVVGVKIKEEFV